MHLSVVGLGKLGLCTAASFAAGGFEVLGLDSDPEVVRTLNAGGCHIKEPGLAELLSRVRTRLSFTGDMQPLLAKSDVTFVVVPTPSQPDGSFDNQYLLGVLEAMAPHLAAKDGFHAVAIVSTVMPGSCDGVFVPLLERATGKSCGRDFGLVYNPEFVALGSVMHDFQNPDLVLIGASDRRSAEMVAGVHGQTVRNRPHFAVLSPINAEIAKLALNCFVTMKISFANELAAVCESLAGAQVDQITEAIGADSRIGFRYLRGGLGFGGPCFPRDNQAFIRFAQGLGHTPRLSPAVVDVNRSVVGRLLSIISARRPAPAKAAVLGLSYKPGTHITEESPSLDLARELASLGYEVCLYDPAACQEAARDLPGPACYDDPYLALSGASVAVLMTDWPELRGLDWSRVEALAPGALLVDCWRRAASCRRRNLEYIALGTGPERARPLE